MFETPEYKHISSIQKDGSRPKIRISDVKGKFTKIKFSVYYTALSLFFILPFVKYGGERTLLLRVDQRIFNVFGYVFNAQDVYLLFFIISGVGFLLFFITALFGRLWCGYLCPQTVLLEGVYRKIERLIEGTKSQQLRLQQSKWTLKKTVKVISKHTLFILISFLLATCFISYFVPLTYFQDIINHGPSSHSTVIVWLSFLTIGFYGNFSWFREQMCLIICPYGRLQSALTDDDTYVIAYDKNLGEPRGKLKDEKRGQCIDCNRCVTVCPTGIDIRAGLQMECIGCANCIDACNEVMQKIDQPQNLIRYDSLNGFVNKKTKILRPRIYVYIVLMLVGCMFFTFFFLQRKSVEVNILRLRGKPYYVEGAYLRNSYEVHVVNKSSSIKNYDIKVVLENENAEVIMPYDKIILKKNNDKRIPIFIKINKSYYENDFEVYVQFLDKKREETIESQKIIFFGPE